MLHWLMHFDVASDKPNWPRMLDSLSVQHVGPAQDISTTVWHIAMKFDEDDFKWFLELLIFRKSGPLLWRLQELWITDFQMSFGYFEPIWCSVKKSRTSLQKLDLHILWKRKTSRQNWVWSAIWELVGCVQLPLNKVTISVHLSLFFFFILPSRRL